jgi:glycosyltransferase involved in cell wall biosynthesis
MTKISVCMIHNYFIWRGGAERLIFTLADQLKRMQFDIEVYGIAFDQKTCFPELTDGIRVRQTNRVIQSRQLRSLPVVQALGLANLLDKHYDIIHAHNFPANIAALFASRKSGTPFVWQCNEPARIIYDPEEQRNYVWGLTEKTLSNRLIDLGGYFVQKFTSKPYDKLAASRAAAITTLTGFTASWVKKLYHRTAISIPPGVDTRVFHPTQSEKRRSIHLKRDPLVLSVTRLWKAKNLSNALVAFGSVLRKFPNAKFVIAGDGPERGPLTDQARRMGLFPNVRFLRDPPYAQIVRYYRTADLFFLPSVNEPWGLSVLESMASGTPVVVSNEGGFPEFVKHDVTGMLVDPRNPAAQADAIIELLSDPARLKAMGREAANDAAGYTWERMASSYAQLYRAIVS